MYVIYHDFFATRIRINISSSGSGSGPMIRIQPDPDPKHCYETFNKNKDLTLKKKYLSRCLEFATSGTDHKLRIFRTDATEVQLYNYNHIIY